MWVFSARQPRSLLALLVAVALLLGAGAGLRHRIAHGLASAPDPVPSKAALHSCAALDAAALGAALAARPLVAALWRQRPPALRRSAPAAADLPVFVHFCARAPPGAVPTAPAPPGGTTGAPRA
jgi:hypothetical protein